jgi:hypothetical protein
MATCIEDATEHEVENIGRRGRFVLEAGTTWISLALKIEM